VSTAKKKPEPTYQRELLKECFEWLDVDVWRAGESAQFSHIEYCRHCHYSRSHGHGDRCLYARLASEIDIRPRL
jgi:hypothetical protein